MKPIPSKNVKNTLIIFVIFLLVFSTFLVGFVDATSQGTTKKASTAAIRSQLKESTKERAERAGACTSNCEVDHKVPLKCGGSNDISNLQSLPVIVHREKTAREAKLCTQEHPERTCGGLAYTSIDGFSLYICSNAGTSSSYTTSQTTPTKKSSSVSTSQTTSQHSGGSTGKQCYVNGYTTKKGTYVHGYYRRCG
jgi:hypothetical protein